MATFRLPNITGLSEKEQISQINRYLFQLVGELQFTINTLENKVSRLETNLQELASKSATTATKADANGSMSGASGL